MATCPNCETPVVPGANFCHVCGRPLAEPGLNPMQARPGDAVAGEPFAPAQPDQMGSAGRSPPSERRIVTILFCDVKGSTELAESLDPEEWVEVMNGAFEHLIKPVYRYGGTVARLMGDAVLALFGAPVAHEDDPQRAVRAGLDMIAGIRAYRERIRHERGLDFDVRVGINTGWVVVGEVGTDLRAEYTVMGDAANLAARMQQTARPGSVQISADTYKLVAPLFEAEALGSLELKGKREAVPAYRVLGLKSKPSPLRGPDGPETPLVGRQAEMATLRRVVYGLRGAGSQLVCLIGEEGLGKSRLIHELRSAWFAQEEQQEALRAVLRQQTGSRLHSWIDGRCLSHEALHPYGQFQYLIRFVCGATEADPPDIVREKIARLAETVSPEQSARFSQVFEALLSVDADTSITPLEGERMKRGLFEVVVGILRAWAEIGPGVLAFDDMHWCDPASVDLLLRLIQVAGDLPVLFLCAFRPDPHSPAWRIKQTALSDWPQRYIELSLRPLSPEDADALIQILLPPADLPHELRRRIRHKAEGNPFFVEEVVRGLVEQGVLARGAPAARAEASIADVAIPDNVQALLVARMDRLPDEVRRTLQLAAVIGRSFSYHVLQLIAGAQPGLEEQLGTLTAADLIRETAPRPELEYTFRSALTQEAAYKSILLRRRRELHLRVGETLETLYADRLEERASLLAHHFDQAADPRAPTYHSLAGDAAFRLHALSEAEAHYARALELSHAGDSHPLRVNHLVTQRGRTLELLGRYDEALHN